MDKQQIIIRIANDMLNSLNISQIVQIARDFSLVKAEDYYDNLPDEEKKKLEEKLTAELAELEKAPQEPVVTP